MPALWPKFIPDLANTISSQQFTKPGGAVVSYDLPEFKSEVGNPLNAALKSNPAEYVNVINPNPLSGRYDFGVKVAEHYIEAVKNYAQTHVAEFHTNNPAAETILKQGYGIAFERLLREGDIPLMDQYDEDGNLIEMGKESHPAYADFCPTEEETAGPSDEELAEMEKENDKAFNKFVAEAKEEYDLYRFNFYQFPCLSGEESQEEIEKIFATRILQGYKLMGSADNRWKYFGWVCHIGSDNYSANSSGITGFSGFPAGPYRSINNQARADITDAGYDWEKLADNVSNIAKAAILDAHATVDTTNMTGSMANQANKIEARIKRAASKDIVYPIEDVCELNPYKIQVAHDFEGNDDYPSQRPKILTSNVVACFTYHPERQSGSLEISNETKALFTKDKKKYDKTKSWVKNKYEDFEWKKKWAQVPENKLKAAAQKADAQKAFFEIDPKPEGTLFKFEYHRALCAKKAAEACEAELEEVAHPWAASGETPDGKVYAGDPYMMMARVTIAYWYACIVKPFKNMPSAPPALIAPPLTGIYIPIYYGSANRLANNLRRAWNTGKSFSVIPATQPPAIAVSTAVAGAYALHLLEFKLLYLGGIPTPFGPIPMVGFVPVVF